jgi:hypothetical protein
VKSPLGPDKNKDLMLAAGSKKGDYDPESPDQWKWLLRHGEAPTEVMMAWIKSKTIAFRHDSPFCVDEHDNALYIQHAAADLGWEDQTVRNVIGTLEKQGRARLEKKRIWYCAYIPQAHEPASGEGRKESEQTNSVQSYKPSYLAEFIEKLSPEKQRIANAKWDACLTWRREFFADGMATLRIIADRVEDTTLLEIGIPKKRLPERKRPGKQATESEKPEKQKWVQVKLFAEPNFVQSCVAEFVQTANQSVQTADPTSYQPKTDFVDARASSSTAAATATREAHAPPSASSPAPAFIDKSSSPPPPPLLAPSKPGKKAEEEDSKSLYRIFKAEYPAGHFDEPKTKPSFEKKTKTEQRHVLDRLRVYLDCERWKDEGGAWIPLSSKWLETYEADPPPLIKKKNRKSKGQDIFDQAFETGGD